MSGHGPMVFLPAARAAPRVLTYAQATRVVQANYQATPFATHLSTGTVQRFCAGFAVRKAKAEATRKAVAALGERAPEFAELAGFLAAGLEEQPEPGRASCRIDPADRRPELLAALERCGGSVPAAAAQLRISPERLCQLLSKSPKLQAARRAHVPRNDSVTHFRRADAVLCGAPSQRYLEDEPAFLRARRRCRACRLLLANRAAVVVRAAPADALPAGPRTRQCKACPWKVSTVPERDIPGGYSAARHHALAGTIAEPGALRAARGLRVMACHESPPGREQTCVGWLANQLGPGNNLAVRMAAMRGEFGAADELELDGPQHARFEDTLPRAGARR